MRNSLFSLVFVLLAGCGHAKSESIKFPVTEPDGRVVEVSKWWGFSLANDPSSEKAFKLLQANKVEEARDTLKDHISAFPNEPYPHYDLALCFEVKADWKSAHDEVQEALKLAPDNRTFKEENAFIERHLAVPPSASAK